MKRKLQILKDLPPGKPNAPLLKAGSAVFIECDDEGIPLEHYWRRRLQDADRDGCCALEPEESPVKRSRRSKSSISKDEESN